MKYLVVYEQGETPNCWGASVPDLNVFAAGKSRRQVGRLIREAVAFHIEGLRERGEPVPYPTSTSSGYVEFRG